MKNYQNIFAALAFCVFLSATVLAQSGGTYEITQSVVANGGGQSDGGSYGLTGTSGQSLAGTNSTAGQFGVRGGFWQGSLTPTAALVAVSGRVLTAENGGIGKVRVTLTDQTGAIRQSMTNPFGYFRFDDVEVGQTYICSVRSKRFQFANETQFVVVLDEITDLVFIALPY